jgi:hypothetical protein
MSSTLDRKVVLDLIRKAKTGNEILSVVDMIIDTFTKPAVAAVAVPTSEAIDF